MIQQKISKIKGVADILFCIDFSGSMQPCIDGVKNHVKTFINALEKFNPNIIVDWQIAFCAYSNDTIIVKDFTKKIMDFSNDLESIDLMGDEFTPGAIDYCISLDNWRKVTNKFMVVFTDEELNGGNSFGPDGDGSSKFPLLLRKIEFSKIHLYYFGPQCTYYSQFEKISRCSSKYLDDHDFTSVDFGSLLNSLGKTVSQSCIQAGQNSDISQGLIYDFSKFNIKKL